MRPSENDLYCTCLPTVYAPPPPRSRESPEAPDTRVHRPMISTSKIVQERTISRPRISARAVLAILGRKIVQICTKMLVEIFVSSMRGGGRVSAVGVAGG